MVGMIGFAAPRDFPEGRIRVFKVNVFAIKRERERGKGREKGKKEKEKEQLEKDWRVQLRDMRRVSRATNCEHP